MVHVSNNLLFIGIIHLSLIHISFSKVDKCIVLEDDDVPAVSFFQFCKEMLDKYEHDTRISMIAGFNPEEITQDMPCLLYTSRCV